MSTKKSTELAKTANEEILGQLAEAYPQEEGGKGIILPRLGMFSQDKTEETGKGKDKKIRVVQAAGEFFIDKESDEEEDIIDEKTGKKTGTRKVWSKTELGDTVEGIIFYKRHQLRMYDESTEKYTSSPIFDTADEVIPLFCDRKEIARGTPADLKAKFMYTNKVGKEVSALEDNRIVYVYYEGDTYQMNFRGSSMYSLLAYERSVQAPTVVTEMSSEAMEKGDIAWNKMTFKAVRKLTAEEADNILELQKKAAQAIALSKASFQKGANANKEADEEMDKLAAPNSKGF